MISRIFQKITLTAIACLAIVACNPKDKPSEEGDKTTSVDVSTSLDVDGSSASHTIPVTITNPVAGKTLTATTSDEWILNLKASNEGISFDVADNLGDLRKGQINVSYDSKDIATIAVTQDEFSFKDFKISFNDISATSVTVTYTPGSYKSNYFFEIFSKSAVDKYLALDSSKPGEMGWGEALYKSDLEYIRSTVHTGMSFSEHIAGMTNMYKVTSSGEATQMRYSKLTLGTEYYAIVYGMDLEGKRTTPIAMKLFRTAAAGASALTFQGSATDITATQATINITPSDNKTTYYWTWADDATYKMVSLPQIQSQMTESILQAVQFYGMSITDYIYIGETSERVEEELSPGTLYHVVAWGLDSNAEITSEAVEVFTFTTLENEITDECTFDVEVLEVQSMDVKARITPSNPDTRYYVAFINEEKCQGMNDSQMVQRIINSENSRMESGSYGEGITWENHPDLFSGTKTFWMKEDLTWTVLPQNNYRLYVFGINGNGEPTTQIKRLDVKSGDPKTSDNTFSVEVKESDWKNVTFHITPSNPNDYYLPFLVPTGDLDTYRHADGSLMEKEVMDQIHDYYEDEIGYNVLKGERDWRTFWTSDKDYSFLVFGYEGTNTTKIYEFKYHSPEIPFGKASCDLSYTYEIFRSEDLKALNKDMWGRYEDGTCIMRVMIQTTGDPEHWYWGIWPPKENYLSSGGIDHLVKLVTHEELDGDNIIDRKGGLLSPWWYGADWAADEDSDYIFKTEEGETMSYMPWSITAYAEDAKGNYGPLHYDLFIPIPKPKAEVTGNREVGYTDAYVFWGGQPAPGTKELIISVPSLETDEFNFEYKN